MAAEINVTGLSIRTAVAFPRDTEMPKPVAKSRAWNCRITHFEPDGRRQRPQFWRFPRGTDSFSGAMQPNRSQVRPASRFGASGYFVYPYGGLSIVTGGSYEISTGVNL